MKRLLFSKTFPFCLSNIKNENFISKSRTSESKSSNLLLQTGLIFPCSTGVYHYSPAMLRSLNKLESLIDKHLMSINGQKLQMASLASKSLWSQTNRWNEFGEELVKTKIGHSDFCLSPTHEEAVCSIIANYQIKLSHAHLPLRLYQTTTKFRGEKNPNSGLLRCREFLMNDLYTFDVDEGCALDTYHAVIAMYQAIFAEIGVEVLKAKAKTGVIGGSLSHEYHIECEVGEDVLFVCDETNEAINAEHDSAPTLHANGFKKIRGIEVGHLFLLGQKYSKTLKASVVSKLGQRVPCHMGCYGLGVSRIVAACLESFSTEAHMRWPVALAPYKVCIIPPKSGSLEEKACSEDLVNNLYDLLQNIPGLSNDVIIDDRRHRTIGQRLSQSQIFGFPLVIVIGKNIRASAPTLEIFEQGKKDEKSLLPLEHVHNFVKQYFEN